MILAIIVASGFIILAIGAIMAKPRPEIERLCTFCALNSTRFRCQTCQLPVCESCELLHDCKNRSRWN